MPSAPIWMGETSGGRSATSPTRSRLTSCRTRMERQNSHTVCTALENRKVTGKVFVVDTGDPKQPLVTPMLRIRPRSSFGVRLDGDFAGAKEFHGVTLRLGSEEFKLAPLGSFDFENLALKIGRLNLGSPDFTDDWRVLNLEALGTRIALRK